MAAGRSRLKVDVAVVGAGPAGTATAISCATAGLAVTLIERERFPRDRPGETLHPGVEDPLRRLGVLELVSQAGFLRHEGIWVRWDDEPARFVPYGADHYGPWRGFQAWRADFDAMLLGRARALGAEVLQPCRALGPTVSGGRVAGLETDRGVVEARFVIDACGSGHWLARRLGLAIRHCSPPLIARFGYLEGACTVRDGAPAITADERGWTWTARVRPGLYHWTRLNLDNTRPDVAFVPDELRGLSSRNRSRGAAVGWRAVENPAGPGYFAVGDAAAVVDPASSHGVVKAVLSGSLAAHLIVGALSGRLDDSVAALEYSAWAIEWFARDVAALRQLYGRLPRPPRWLDVLGSPRPRTS
jgi:flavin-dependent dehydrogenase